MSTLHIDFFTFLWYISCMLKEEILEKYASAKEQVKAETIMIEGKSRVIYRASNGQFASNKENGANYGARMAAFPANSFRRGKHTRSPIMATART